MAANTEQPDEEVCKMGTKHASVCVKFVDNYEVKFPEKFGPGLMVRQYCRIEHIWVCYYYVRIIFYFFSLGRGSVSVIGEGLYIDSQSAAQFSEFGKLVLGEGLCREKIERPS